MAQSLKIVSDGTWEGTQLLDAATGEPFTLEGAHVNCHVKGSPEGGRADVVITLAGVPVKIAESVKTGFEFFGHNGNG